jgi:hypothetical protein
VLAQLRKIAEGLRSRFPKAAALLEDAAKDILAYRHLLRLEHQRQLHSTNPLEVGSFGWSARFCSSKTTNGPWRNGGTSAPSR